MRQRTKIMLQVFSFVVVALFLTGAKRASGQGTATFTRWAPANDAFSEASGSLTSSAEVKGLPGVRVNMTLACVDGRPGDYESYGISETVAVTGKPLDIMVTPVRVEGGTVISPTLSYYDRQGVIVKERLDSGSPVTNEYVPTDSHHFTIQNKVSTFVDIYKKSLKSQVYRIGFSTGGESLTLELNLSRSDLSSFMIGCGPKQLVQVRRPVPFAELLRDNITNSSDTAQIDRLTRNENGLLDVHGRPYRNGQLMFSLSIGVDHPLDMISSESIPYRGGLAAIVAAFKTAVQNVRIPQGSRCDIFLMKKDAEQPEWDVSSTGVFDIVGAGDRSYRYFACTLPDNTFKSGYVYSTTKLGFLMPYAGASAR